MSDFLFEEENGSAVGTGAAGDGLVFNLTDVEEDRGFDIIPKGDYPCIVDEQEFGESKSGNPMITTKFKITEGEYEGRVVFDYWVLAGKGSEFGLGKLKKFLTRVTPEADLAAFNPETFCEDGEAINRECIVTLGVQKQTKGEYKGESRNTVKDIKPASNGSFL